MAGSIYLWSTTAANNGTVDPDVPWPEGMARRQVNDSARGIMGRVAEWVGDQGGALTAGGTANALTVTANSGFTSYADGQRLTLKASATNTGAATLSVNAIGTKAIRRFTTSGDAALIGGEIQDDGVYEFVYSSDANSAAGGWLLINPTIIQDLTTTDNAIARFDGTNGALQNSTVTISDTGDISANNLTVAQTVTSNNGRFVGISGGGNCLLATVGLGTIRLRPQGAESSNGEVTLASGGTLTTSGNMVVGGSLSKSSGTFNIEHPLNGEKRLVHGFVEAPRYDLIYRGIVDLVDGDAIVDIDEASGMTPGTFEALTTNAVVCSLQNQGGFDRVLAGPVVGGRFEIRAESELCSDTIAWVVIAERNDAFVRDADANCDEDGRLLVEPVS